MVSSQGTLRVLGGTLAIIVGAAGIYLLLGANRSKSREEIDHEEENDIFTHGDHKVWALKTNIDLDETIKDQTAKQELNIKIERQNTKNDNTWTCLIKGTIPNPQEGKNLNEVETQLKTLKTSIGINEKGNIDASKENQFRNFIYNCKRHRTDKDNVYKRIIDLGELELKNDSSSYKFKDEEINKLHEENFLSNSFKTKLGIPTDCKINVSCDLDTEKLKKIKFFGQENPDIEEGNQVNLEIKAKLDRQNFRNGLKFIFKSPNKDLTITNKTSQPNKQVKLKKNSNIEFKLNISGDKYSLENAWTKESLMGRVNLQKSDNNKFTFKDGSKINVLIPNSSNENNYITKATLNNNDINKKLTVEEKEGYNHGLEIKAEEDINLIGGTSKTSNNHISKLSREKSYEVDFRKVGETEDWFFIEKNS